MKKTTALFALCAPLLARSLTAQPFVKAVRANGVELHYVEQGKGDAIVFVHGGLEDYRAWQPQLEAMAGHYRTVAYSRRYNYPNSGAPARTDYSAVGDADDLAALIGALKLSPARIIGVSHGASVALWLAVRHPELVRSMVLSEPPMLRWLPDLEGGTALFADFMNKVWAPATRGFRVGDEAGVKAAVDGFGEAGYSGSAEKMTFAGLPPEVRRAALQNAAEWKALTLSKDAFPVLSPSAVKGVKAPTLLLSGQRSLALHGVIDKELEKLLPQHERIILANATHEMWNEYPDKCRHAALAFFVKH